MLNDAASVVVVSKRVGARLSTTSLSRLSEHTSPLSPSPGSPVQGRTTAGQGVKEGGVSPVRMLFGRVVLGGGVDRGGGRGRTSNVFGGEDERVGKGGGSIPTPKTSSTTTEGGRFVFSFVFLIVFLPFNRPATEVPASACTVVIVVESARSGAVVDCGVSR